MAEKKKIVVASKEETSRYAPGSEASSLDKVTDAQRQEDEASGQGVAEGETIESLRAELEAYKDKLLRAQAECANISKRLHQQHAESLKLAGMDLARDLLPVVDSFERTLSGFDEFNADDPVVQGVRMIADQLLKVLKDHGVEPIQAVGMPFDPTLHEAVMQDKESDLAPGLVSAELQRGYKMNERVLRATKVTVAAEPEESAGQ
ncbi:MAG: nucleotide exchange factor GrpE [Phycisphaerae bacterium]|nr:nucleotide exchange factor GrpE [Phycisphaerae bacterium]